MAAAAGDVAEFAATKREARRPFRDRTPRSIALTQTQHLPEADDDLDRRFPGSSLTHVLTIISDDCISAVVEALTTIQASGGGLEALRLTRLGDKLEQRLRLTGLRPGQARLLSSRLADIADIERVSIEHQIVRMGRLHSAAQP